MLKIYRKPLLALAAAALAFGACKKSDKADGLGLPVDGAITGVKVPDTLTVLSTTVAADTFSTTLEGSYPVAYMADDAFGTTQASTAMNVLLPAAGFSFGTNAVLDSAVLVLRYAGTSYGDTTQAYPFEVRQLAQPFIDETNFLNTRNWAVQPAVVGSKTTRLYPNTIGYALEPVAGKTDTLRKLGPQLRIPLNKDFITQQMLGLSSSALTSNATFGRVFNGLAVALNTAQVKGKGGAAFFRFDNNLSSVDVYFKRQNATNTAATDTVRASFPIRNSSASGNAAAESNVAASIKHNYAGTVAAQGIAAGTKATSLYTQGLGGVSTRVWFPYLSRLKAAAGGNIVINKAELVVEVQPDSYFGTPPAMSLYKKDIAGTPQLIDDLSQAGDAKLFPYFGGTLESGKNRYVFQVTTYIQNLIDGRTQDYGTYIIPNITTGYLYTPNTQTAARAIIKKGIKLNIYYSKVK